MLSIIFQRNKIYYTWNIYTIFCVCLTFRKTNEIFKKTIQIQYKLDKIVYRKIGSKLNIKELLLVEFIRTDIISKN